MDKDPAIAVWLNIERLRFPEEVIGDDSDAPIFKVRLDAGDDGDYGRDYRVRISEVDSGFSAGGENWRKVIEIAEEADPECWVQVQNNGIELS